MGSRGGEQSMYVINPIVFYLINLAQTFKTVLSIVSLVALFIVAFIVYSIIDDSTNDDEDGMNEVNKFIKTVATIAIVTGFFAIVLPNKETSYQMLVASQITDKNIEIAESTIKDSVDYIFEKLGK